MPLMAADWGESQVKFDKTALMRIRLQMSRWQEPKPGPSKLCLVWQGDQHPPGKGIRDDKWAHWEQGRCSGKQTFAKVPGEADAPDPWKQRPPGV